MCQTEGEIKGAFTNEMPVVVIKRLFNQLLKRTTDSSQTTGFLAAASRQ